jgi:hypothetical protein
VLSPREQLELDMYLESALYGQIFLVRQTDGTWRVLKQSEFDITVTPKGTTVKEKHASQEAS